MSKTLRKRSMSILRTRDMNMNMWYWYIYIYIYGCSFKKKKKVKKKPYKTTLLEWWRQSAVAELLEWWRHWKIKEKTEIKKPTKWVNPHDLRVNPTQTNFKWVRFGLTRFFTGSKIPHPYPYFTLGFGRVNGSRSNFAKSTGD